MKRAGFLIDRIADTDNLLRAYHKARRGKAVRRDVKDYSLSLDENIYRLRKTILDGTVSVGDYTYFRICDPKPRLICAAAFEERVLHHAIMNVCHPYFERHLIETTYATRLGKGLYQALNRVSSAARKYPFVAKFDFRKYFDTINHDILKSKLGRLFKDKDLLCLFNKIIDSYHSSQFGCGLPIGNLTSQYFANYYLSSMDHYCKEILRIKEYIRYMDDFLVFANTENELKRYVSLISAYASDKLFLELKMPVLNLTKDGIPFCGYRIYPHKMLLNSRSKRRFARKLILYQSFLYADLWTERQYLQHILPLLAFAGFAYTKGLRRKLLSYGDRHAGSNRVLRGGNYWNNARNCRVSNRNNNNPDNRNNNNGLRLVLVP